MFAKLFEDIPKVTRFLTRAVGIIGIIGSAIAVLLNLQMMGSAMGMGMEMGMGMSGFTMLGGSFGAFLIATINYLLIIVAGEIVARVYSVWEKQNYKTIIIDSDKVELGKEDTDV